MQMADLFDNLGHQAPKAPPTEEDWLQLEFQGSQLFTPHTPISEEDLLAGRSPELKRLVDVVFQEGQHALLYGERGVGKSSLANILKDKVFSKTKKFKIIKRSCTADHDYKLIWQHLFSDFNYDGVPAPEWISSHNNPFDIYQLIEGTSEELRPIFIIDEFDRVTDMNTKRLMSDTMKYLSDYASKATIIIVGVAGNVSELVASHQSITRNTEQVRMLRMNTAELRQILDTRLRILGMKAEAGILEKIVALSQGLPGYTHKMGQGAALSAIGRRKFIIAEFDLAQAIRDVIASADESISKAYADSVRSTKPDNLYREALLACALAGTDDRGYFSAAAMRQPFSKIVGKPRDIPSFARHLKEFIDPARGPTLVREGKKKSYEYRFHEPLLRPYVVIRGIAEGLIHHADL